MYRAGMGLRDMKGSMPVLPLSGFAKLNQTYTMYYIFQGLILAVGLVFSIEFCTLSRPVPVRGSGKNGLCRGE